MSEPQVTVRTTETGRVTEVVVPGYAYGGDDIRDIILAQVPQAEIDCVEYLTGIRQPNGPDIVAYGGDVLRIAQGRVERVSE